MKSHQQFFAELKRRRVFKVTAIYGATAFVLLQVAELLGQGLRLPDSFMPFITAVILLGFPLALILTWAFQLTPEGVKRTEAAAPGEIEGIVARPASERWPSGLLAILGIAALLAGTWWAGRTSAPGATADGAGPDTLQLAYAQPEDDARPSLAVLPFVNMSADENQEYFSDGMTEELLNSLTKIEELKVAGRTSAFAYKGRSVDLRQIGGELGVRYLVEGSVRKAGNRLRITAQLIDASDGSHLWSEQYDRDLEDVFAIQTEIAEAIAGELRVPLGLDTGETLVTPTGDLDAYDLYLAGRARMRLRGEGLREAIALFEAALARDSAWAPAWAALAEASEITIWHTGSLRVEEADLSAFMDSAQARAERAARRALELDPDNASALVALGSVQRNRAEWEASEASYRRALAVDPDNAEAHQQYADLLYNMGRTAEAVREADRGWALDPASIRAETLGFALILDARFEEAADVCLAALERAPEATRERLLLHCFGTQLDARRADRALEVFGELVRRGSMPAFPPESWEEERPKVEALVGAIVRGSMADLPPEFADSLAAGDLFPETWMMVGEPDSALVALFAIARSSPYGRTAEFWHPKLDPLRSHPEVQAWLEERGLGGVEPRRTPEKQRVRPLILREPAAGSP